MCYIAKSCLQRGEISQHAKLEPKRSPCPRPCSILRALDVDHCSQGRPPPFPFPSACCCTGWCMAVLPTMVPNRSRCRMAEQNAVESGIADAGNTVHEDGWMDGWMEKSPIRFSAKQGKMPATPPPNTEARAQSRYARCSKTRFWYTAISRIRLLGLLLPARSPTHPLTQTNCHHSRRVEVDRRHFG